MTTPAASILVPTHDHAGTLPIAVGSALRQTVPDIEVILVGDGVDDATRDAARALCSDPRVRFLDLPKGEHHGEAHRHTAILAARSDAIFYLCDDDLLMPGHVANLLDLLREADFVNSANGIFLVDGALMLFAQDLADPESVQWHLAEPRRNTVGITGTAHSRAFYLGLDEPWAATPEGEWPDHYMWKKFFRRPGLRAATHPEMTVLAFPTSSGREDWDQEARVRELAVWDAFSRDPGSPARLQQLVARARTDALHDLFRRVVDQGAALDEAQRALHDLAIAREAAASDADAARAEAREARDERDALLGSTSWRVTRPWRAARRVLPRRPARG